MTVLLGWAGRTSRTVISWLPLLSATALVSLLYVRGWTPALAESDRLDQAAVEVSARRQALQAIRSDFANDEGRIEDPFWSARVQKSLERAGQPLRLESLVRNDADRKE